MTSTSTKTLVERFYDASYWQNYQGREGDFWSRVNQPRFLNYCQPDGTLLDLGCGGGWLLRDLPAKRRIGVDVNAFARSKLPALGIVPCAALAELPDSCVDTAISNHALEHMVAPLEQIDQLFRVLRPGAFAIFVVPSETILSRYKSDDKDQHLYTWSPANLGNLFRAAGFKVHSCRPYFDASTPKVFLVQRLLGWPLFRLVCTIWALVRWHSFQVRIVAQKPD